MGVGDDQSFLRFEGDGGYPLLLFDLFLIGDVVELGDAHGASLIRNAFPPDGQRKHRPAEKSHNHQAVLAQTFGFVGALVVIGDFSRDAFAPGWGDQ